jgi:hypothetical protein
MDIRMEGPMSRSPSHLLIPIIALAGCGGIIDGGISSSTRDLYCYGDPDTSIVCVAKEDVWTCEAMPNGEEKCQHTPDGESGWTCTTSGGNLVCTKDSPTAGGGAGWECVSDEFSTTCTSVGSTGGSDGGLDGFSPPGGGEWSCTGTSDGVICIGTPATGDGTGTVDGPPNTGSSGGAPEPGDFRTQTPGGWGAPASGNNPGAYRDANFDSAFPSGLSIGCSSGYTALFTSASAIEAFVPAGGTPGVLDQDLVDPVTTSGGVLAGHVVALSLAVGFDASDPNFGGTSMTITSLVATSGACAGMTVAQILHLANSIVGGCNAQLTPSEITSCVDAINNNFVDGAKAGGYLAYP